MRRQNLLQYCIFVLYSTSIQCTDFVSQWDCSCLSKERLNHAASPRAEAEFMNGLFRWGWAKSWELSDLRFPCTMFTLKTCFKPLLFKRGRWLWIARKKTLKTIVPITFKNSASGDANTTSSFLYADHLFVLFSMQVYKYIYRRASDNYTEWVR